jgi:hypothetical protein
MLIPPNAVAAADAFNRVRREIVILFLPGASLFVLVSLKGPCCLVIMPARIGQAFSAHAAFAAFDFVGWIGRGCRRQDRRRKRKGNP